MSSAIPNVQAQSEFHQTRVRDPLGHAADCSAERTALGRPGCHDAGMSYDLAVWDGPKPANNAEATAEYGRRMDAMEETFDGPDEHAPPTPAIQTFIEAALARFPELDDDSGPECPWAASPLEGEAVGDLIYFPMTFSGAEYARDPLAEIADSLGLVCFDPQIEQMLPDPDATPASTIADSAYEALARHIEAEQSKSRPNWLKRLLRKR
jgi:hypothetical protein